MSVRGSLRTMSVEDLLDWIDRRSRNGTLTVESASVVRAFQFDSGYVIGATSNATNEQPAQLLVGMGLLAQPALDQALAEQAGSQTPLATILVKRGDIDEHKLSATLEQQATESLLDALVWSDGGFSFEPINTETVMDFPISVRLRSCIVQGRQRNYRWNRIRQLIAHDDVTLQVIDDTRLLQDSDDADVKKSLVDFAQAIKTGWTIQQIIQRQYGRRYFVLDVLATSVERGALALAEGKRSDQVARAGRPVPGAQAKSSPGHPRAAASATRFEKAARAQIDAGNTNKALELAYQALRIEPQNPAIQKLHASLERSVFAELSRELLTSFRVPELLVARDELDRLDLSGTERYLAGRVDGRWDLLSLMRVAPVREVEALITFKRLADRGIISL